MSVTTTRVSHKKVSHLNNFEAGTGILLDWRDFGAGTGISFKWEGYVYLEFFHTYPNSNCSSWNGDHALKN